MIFASSHYTFGSFDECDESDKEYWKLKFY